MSKPKPRARPQAPGGSSGRRGAPRSCCRTWGTSVIRRRLPCPRPNSKRAGWPRSRCAEAGLRAERRDASATHAPNAGTALRSHAGPDGRSRRKPAWLTTLGVERRRVTRPSAWLPKPGVAGSNPVVRSRIHPGLRHLTPRRRAPLVPQTVRARRCCPPFGRSHRARRSRLPKHDDECSRRRPCSSPWPTCTCSTSSRRDSP